MGLALASGALAAARPATQGDDIPDVLVEALSPGTTVEQYVAQLANRLRGADRDGDGLDAADIALARDKRRAQLRSSRIGQLLSDDLNGDLKVTREELNRTAPLGSAYYQQQVERTLAAYDANRDGVITLAEMTAAIENEDRGDTGLEGLLALDTNGDGKLTAAELRARAEQAFSRIDSDADGRLSQPEYAAISQRLREIAAVRNAPKCVLPPVPADAKLVVFGTYEGQALSSVAIGGQDQETNLIDVDIEPGAAPLYLVLTSYESMAWRLTGATGRVVRVLVSSYHTPEAADGFPRRTSSEPPRIVSAPEGVIVSSPPRVVRGVEGTRRISASGVIGMPADRVTIADARCPGYLARPEAAEGNSGIAVLKALLRRAPDAVFTGYSAQRIAFPSGKITMSERDTAPLPPGFDPAVWAEAARFWRAGLVQVDPRRVVAEASVEPYSVLPSQMGLAQLVGSGALQQVGSETFRVLRPIPRLPSSMGGAHSVTLILAKGVPVPQGDPVHSCIVVEATGEKIGATCDIRVRIPQTPPSKKVP
jgi:hypothetical protein